MPYLPPGTKGHELDLEVDASTSAFDLIDQFGISRCEAYLVLCNGVYLYDEQRALPLKDGDTIAIWPPVAGG